MAERLDKQLGNTGRWSRKEAQALIRAGRVTVAGLPERDPGAKPAEGAPLCVDGDPIAAERFVYLMLHKPQGLISSTEDPREPTVLELLPPAYRRIGLFPVGRLDKDTEGLLLLCNDGALAHRLLSPRHHVDKCYYVQVEGDLRTEDVLAFEKGMLLRDGTLCRPAVLDILSPPSEALVTLREGKYHQVKRMLAACGKPVRYLKRLSMGSLHLDDSLQAGAFRSLTAEELGRLMEETVSFDNSAK